MIKQGNRGNPSDRRSERTPSEGFTKPRVNIIFVSVRVTALVNGVSRCCTDNQHVSVKIMLFFPPGGRRDHLRFLPRDKKNTFYMIRIWEKSFLGVLEVGRST